MGQMLLVTLREGIEMFLIIAIAVAYLRKTGRHQLLPAVGWGAGIAVLASTVAFIVFWTALFLRIRREPASQGTHPPQPEAVLP